MKTILITGCSSGFGLETAKYFLDRDWNVIATMRTPKEGILPESENLRILPLDVTSEESINAAIEAAGPIDVLVNNAGIGMLNAVEGTSDFGFAWLAFVVNLPIAFLVPSSSGHAALVMPILAPLSAFADVQASLSVTAYQSASGFINYITPTSAVVMGGLTLAKVGYDRYLRFVAPFLLIAFIIISIFMGIGVAIG